MRKKVAVLLGGRSAERQVSLKTGEAVYQALLSKGYEALKIDATGPIVEELNNFKPDIVFIALHGRYGEDGTIQGLLETLDIPYTGCGVLASALAMNKIYTKKILRYEGIPTADFLTISAGEFKNKETSELLNLIRTKLGYPVVVKAPTQGSTIGIYFVKKEEELLEAINNAFAYDSVIMAEKFIVGTEVTISVLGNEQPFALPSLEIISKTGVYDYQAKYTVGLSEHIIPARVPAEVQEKLSSIAVESYKAIGCRGFARVDFIVGENGQPYVLEINTIPGMTETSLLPDAAKAAGIEFPDLVEMIINLGMEK
ncbi:D-alanine--D-alanine ligase [Zhaonella formicivorans]|uniref:D-alanine--D-alanine ligase n=1 Tax=Zhaonella formicivorans TaxID=2528593 RepID=UPI0010EB4691|nr:D-alanine--D-alanine ligase [Zhaonella formicivorans]